MVSKLLKDIIVMTLKFSFDHNNCIFDLRVSTDTGCRASSQSSHTMHNCSLTIAKVYPFLVVETGWLASITRNMYAKRYEDSAVYNHVLDY